MAKYLFHLSIVANCMTLVQVEILYNPGFSLSYIGESANENLDHRLQNNGSMNSNPTKASLSKKVKMCFIFLQSLTLRLIFINLKNCNFL